MARRTEGRETSKSLSISMSIGVTTSPLAPEEGLSKRGIRATEDIKEDWLTGGISHRHNEGELFHELLVITIHRHVMELASLPPDGRAAFISSLARATGGRMLP